MAMDAQPRSKKAKVRCPHHGDVLVAVADLVIDDEENVYRFTCPTCRVSVDKPMDDTIRGILRSNAVRTIDEMCAAFGALLSDDRAVWRALLEA